MWIKVFETLQDITGFQANDYIDGQTKLPYAAYPFEYTRKLGNWNSIETIVNKSAVIYNHYIHVVYIPYCAQCCVLISRYDDFSAK